MKRFINTPDPVTELLANEVFVFGANSKGLHGGGSAYAANQFFGAVIGEIHRTGRCYGIVTMHPGKEKPFVESDLNKEFKAFFKAVESEPEKEFLMTKVGLGIAGWTFEDIFSAFKEHYVPKIHTNITLPVEFSDELAKSQLTNYEKFLIFVQYLGKPIAIFDSTDGIPTVDTIEGFDFVSKEIIAERASYHVNEIKLILKKDILVKDAEEMSKLFFNSIESDAEYFLYCLASLKYNKLLYKDAIGLINILREFSYEIPTPFSSSHWAYGKSLFELGLAIPSKES